MLWIIKKNSRQKIIFTHPSLFYALLKRKIFIADDDFKRFIALHLSL